MTIQLVPSNDTNILTETIKTANSTNQTLVLLPGVHYTRPGYLLSIPIGPNGLTLSGDAEAHIKRPDNSIGKVGPDNKLGRKDDNYGIYLVPAPPLNRDPELAHLDWREHRPKGKHAFEYTILMRGRVLLSGVTLNCNMGNQGVGPDPLERKKYAHSAMLAIRGAQYPYRGDQGPLGRRVVFVGFEEVQLNNLTLLQGGYADDIWFPPGYFRPNITQVKLSGLVSRPRVSEIRATVGFSGLSQHVSINDCHIDDLHCEVDSHWSEAPGPPSNPPVFFEQSSWTMNRVQAAAMDFAVKGDALTLTGSKLTVTKSFQIHAAAGSLSDSHLTLSLSDHKLIGLRDFHFRGCTWFLSPDADKKVNGLALESVAPRGENPGHLFEADFDRNKFLVNGNFADGQLIAAPQTHGLNVTASFTNCKYQPGFATPAFPKTHIASLHERGKYSFRDADLAGLNKPIDVPPQTVVTQNGGTTEYEIP